MIAVRYTDACLVRSVVQHKVRMHNKDWRRDFLELLGLDEEYDAEAIMALEQFFSDICCHVLERLVVDPPA